MKMEYNTTEAPLKLPVYGRLVQGMVDYALTIEDRATRQAYAEKIVRVMELLNPQMRTTPNYEETLWNHLALMADYRLDIDYPCETAPCEEHRRPGKLAYPGNRIRFRHYGHLLEQALEEVGHTAPDDPAREGLVRAVAVRMKRYLADWKGDGIDDEKVARDMAMYTDGAVGIDEVIGLLEQAERKDRSATPSAQRFNRRGRK